jgi:secreted trypsin-like serine protease
VIGWGALYYNGPSASELMQVSVPITNNQRCRQLVANSVKQVCAGYDEGRKDSCQGDSGGPLLIERENGIFELIGIVSFGKGCAGIMEPGMKLFSYKIRLMNIFHQYSSYQRWYSLETIFNSISVRLLMMIRRRRTKMITAMNIVDMCFSFCFVVFSFQSSMKKIEN